VFVVYLSICMHVSWSHSYVRLSMYVWMYVFDCLFAYPVAYSLAFALRAQEYAKVEVFDAGIKGKGLRALQDIKRCACG